MSLTDINVGLQIVLMLNVLIYFALDLEKGRQREASYFLLTVSAIAIAFMTHQAIADTNDIEIALRYTLASMIYLMSILIIGVVTRDPIKRIKKMILTNMITSAIYISLFFWAGWF